MLVVLVVFVEVVVVFNGLEAKFYVTKKYPLEFLATPKPTNWKFGLTMLAK